jgi:hypothetical protein
MVAHECPRLHPSTYCCAPDILAAARLHTPCSVCLYLNDIACLSPAGALCQFPVLALSRELYIYQMWDFSNDYGFWNGCGNLVGHWEGGDETVSCDRGLCADTLIRNGAGRCPLCKQTYPCLDQWVK